MARKKKPSPTTRREVQAVWCGQRGCHRFTFENDWDWEWWLTGSKFGGDPLVVRCPQHITEWSMRLAGLGRGMDAYRFARMAKENDPLDRQAQLFDPKFLLY